MKYEPLGKFVELSQGLVVNKSTAHMFSDFQNEDFPFPLLRIVDFENGKRSNYSKYVTKNVPSKVIIDEHSIVFTRVTCQCYRGFRGVFHNNLFLVKLVSDEISEDYLYAVLRSEHVKKQAMTYALSSVVPDLTHEMFKSILIPLPDRKTQDNIAAINNALSEKIEINDSVSSDLESMAKLLYDYWFVQFDFPDENGKPYKSNGGKMVWNEELKRDIPEGWEVHPLQDFIATSKNGDWGNESPKKESDIQVRCFRGADFSSITNNYQTTAPIRFISKNNADRLLSDGDLVIEISGGSPVQSTGRIGYISQKFLDRCGGIMDCSNFCKAFTPRKRLYQYWLYQTWKMYYDAGVMFNFEGKTTGIKNLMFDSVVRDIKVPTPPDLLLREYQQTVSLYYDKTQESFMESSELASLRDFLLPMLMNGQVKITKNTASNE